MATYFGTIAVPTDNGTSATSPVTFANPPLASMATGDLVIVYGYCRNANATITVNNTGGQSWTSETTHQSSTATLTGRIFWCRFNGTWSAAPSFAFSSTTNTNVVMHVFRPNTSTNSWALGTASFFTTENSLSSNISQTTYSIPAGIGGTYTTDQDNTVNLAIASSHDDNTWGNITGTGWTQVTSPSNQFRNTSGNDVSSAYAYNIKATAGTVNQLTIDQLTLGGDPGIQGLYIWYEFTPAATSLKDIIGQGIIPYLR